MAAGMLMPAGYVIMVSEGEESPVEALGSCAMAAAGDLHHFQRSVIKQSVSLVSKGFTCGCAGELCDDGCWNAHADRIPLAQLLLLAVVVLERSKAQRLTMTGE